MFRVVECTGCFCGSDGANRQMCTETNLEIDHSEETGMYISHVKVDLVILSRCRALYEQVNEPSGSIKYAKYP